MVVKGKKLFHSLLLLLVGLTLLSPCAVCQAQTSPLPPCVEDMADLLTEEEERQLNELAEKLGAKHEVTFFVVTVNSTGYDVEGFSEEYYRNLKSEYGSAVEDSIILTIDMDYRYADVSGQGGCVERMDDRRCDRVFSKISSALSNGNYMEACEKFLKTSASYLDYRPGVNPDFIFFRTWFQLLLGVLIGIGGVSIMLIGYGSKEPPAGVYFDAKSSRFSVKNDRYLYTNTTHTYIARSSSSGGGGGGGHSGGGSSGSHGGGHF